MSSEFLTYGRLGLSHIADLQGYDHILFIVALTSSYLPRDWRRLLVLVTAFTVGHSVTLVLATFGVVRVSSVLVETLIPLTIVVTALRQFGRRPPGTRDTEGIGGQGIAYLLAVGFGLIHGLGFSSFLRAAIGPEDSIFVPLLGFNVGLEVGQLVIVGVVLLAGSVACGKVGVSRRAWSGGLAAITALLGLRMFVDRLAA